MKTYTTQKHWRLAREKQITNILQGDFVIRPIRIVPEKPLVAISPFLERVRQLGDKL